MRTKSTTSQRIHHFRATLLLLSALFFLLPGGLRAMGAVAASCPMAAASCPCCAKAAPVGDLADSEGDDGGCCGLDSPCGTPDYPDEHGLIRSRAGNGPSLQPPLPAMAALLPSGSRFATIASVSSRSPHPFPRSSLVQQRTVVLLI